MTLPLTAPKGRRAAIAESFGARASGYEAHAGLQRGVAERLASHLPDLKAPRILELACGTGLLSRHLAARYPDGEIVFSDLSEKMLAACRDNLGEAAANETFAVIDAARPADLGPFDLIVTSMSLHWLDDPVAALEGWRRRLAPGGELLYAGLGEACFAEWRASLSAEGVQEGLVPLPKLPGIFAAETHAMEEGGLSFLRRLQAIGGLTPRDGYRPLSPGALRGVLRRIDRDHDGRVTWQIVYGRLSPRES